MKLPASVEILWCGSRTGRAAIERRDGSNLVVDVTDTGRGIPADRLTAIFEPFVQVERHKTPRGNEGIGPGLAISRDLARNMGGDLVATSTLGSGSPFTLTLKSA